MKLRKRSFELLSFSLLLFITVVRAINVDLYLNRDKFGEYFKLEISEKGCTNVPLNWENQATSLDTHGSCIKFYDLPYCRGKFVALQPYHGTFQDNLATLGFDKIISSASPCGPKLPTGRYYLQNGADGSVLTIETRNGTPIARTKTFQPYIAKGQQFQLEKVALADYELIPRVHEKLNPITFDMSVSTNAHPVRRTWKIESVYKGKYIIKNEWNNKCLYKAESGKVEEHDCLIWSPNQEWIFRSIKVKPFFPSKQELNQKPLRPDDDFPFDPQSHTNFVGQRIPSVPFNRVRPSHPAVALGYHNPHEKFPPVIGRPIIPGPVVLQNKNQKPKAPVPHVRHPGLLPFPPEPVVTQPRKPVTLEDLKKAAAAAKKKKKQQEEEEDDLTSEEKKKRKKKKEEDYEEDDLTSDEKENKKNKKKDEDDEDEDDDLTSDEKQRRKNKKKYGKEDEEDDLNSDEKESENKKPDSDENDDEKKSDETEDKKSEEKGGSDEENKSEENDDKESSREKDSDDKLQDEEDQGYDKRHRYPGINEETAITPKYSDYRLYF